MIRIGAVVALMSVRTNKGQKGMSKRILMPGRQYGRPLSPIFCSLTLTFLGFINIRQSLAMLWRLQGGSNVSRTGLGWRWVECEGQRIEWEWYLVGLRTGEYINIGRWLVTWTETGRSDLIFVGQNWDGSGLNIRVKRSEFPLRLSTACR